MERVWPHRVWWRLRGAWQWPTFVVLTVVDGILLAHLPFYDDGPGGVVPGILLAGFLNLFLVAVVAPLGGEMLRRARPDLPRIIARDYAGTTLLAAVTGLLVLGGLLHRPAVADEQEDERAVAASVHDYVLSRAPEYRDGLGSIDALRIVPDEYRACVPGDDPTRWLCLIVTTDQHPPGITLDNDQAPNSTYRRHGGF